VASPIKTERLRKAYRPKTAQELVALDGLDLEVKEGDIFGFIGPNGAGKSTSIKILVGLCWPTSGQASIFGHPAGSIEGRRRLGYLPEIAHYHEYMAVRELLEIHAQLAGVPSANVGKQCSDALEAVALSHRATSRMRELSKGMQQRFGIAQALVAAPPLLILDEPTSGLDPLAQKEVKDVILGLKKRGMTIFFSSHKLTEVEHICDVIGILHRGKLLCCTGITDFLESQDTVEVRYKGSDKALREGGFESRPENGVLVLTTSRTRLDQALDVMRQSGGSLWSVQPQRRTLEDAFFDLIRSEEAARR